MSAPQGGGILHFWVHWREQVLLKILTREFNPHCVHTTCDIVLNLI